MTLHQLLQTDQNELRRVIDRLEQFSGQPGQDVRLLAEIIGKSHMGHRSLGLDPRDSHGREVYMSLVHLVKKHDEFIARHLHVDESAGVAEIIEAVERFINKLHIPRSVWVMKYSSVKRLLKKQPPKRTLKLLGYRSIDSMLKREPVAHVLAVAKQFEAKTWQQRYHEQYKKLRPSDFEERHSELCCPNTRHWPKIAGDVSTKAHTNILSVPEIGAVLLLPPPADVHRRMMPLALLTFTLLAHEELRMHSSFYKLKQVSAQFGDDIYQSTTEHSFLKKQINDIDIHWKIVHSHFGRYGDNEAIDAVMPEPHVTLDDFAMRKVEDILLSIEPALSFWRDMEYVGATIDDELVSFNLLDAVVNTANQIDYSQRLVVHMQSALWDELLVRYVGNNHVRATLLDKWFGGGSLL